MFFFAEFLALMPSVFNLTVDIQKLLNGTATPEEWDAVVQDIANAAVSLPQLSSFSVVIGAGAKILETMIPAIEAQLAVVNAPAKLVADATVVAPAAPLIASDLIKDLSFDDVNRGKLALRLLNGVNEHIAKYVKEKASIQAKTPEAVIVSNLFPETDR